MKLGIAVSVSHPNICPVFDFGEHGGIYFLAMDYVLGEPLSAVMPRLVEATKGKGLRERCNVAAWIAASVAEGLHAAHETLGNDGKPLNVVHRDVSPSNIFVRYDGHIQIVDFGLASAADKVHHTGSGIAKGKIPYMSPEQFRGDPIDRRVDLWAIGVVLYEMISGKPLFRRDTDAKTMHAVLNDSVPPLWEHAMATPQELNRIVQRLLSKNPEDRYATSQDLAADLRSYLRKAAHPGSQSVEGWMQQLFKGRKSLKLRMMDEVRTRKSEPPGLLPPQHGATAVPSNLIEDVSTLIQTQVIGAGRNRWAWAFGIVIVLAAAAVAIAFLLRPEAKTIERRVVVERRVESKQEQKAKAVSKTKVEPTVDRDAKTRVDTIF